MNVAQLSIHILGIGFGIYLTMVFYGIFWEMKPVRKLNFVLGFCIIGLLKTITVAFFHTGVILALVSIISSFFLAQYFQANMTSKALFSVLFTALLVVSEMIVGVALMLALGASAEDVQNNFIAYTVGLLASRLVGLFLIYAIKFIKGLRNQGFNKWFNLLLLFLPLQSLTMCAAVYGIAGITADGRITAMSMFVLLVSFSVLVITLFIIKKQSEALEYKRKYELTQSKLQAQLEHYNELYQAGQEIRGIKHDMQSTLVAINGLLKDGHAQGAIERIEKMQSNIRQTEPLVNTGYPMIDAIVSAKMKKASDCNISIVHKIMIEELHVDQLDIALILANALDNAIEAVMKSPNVDPEIYVLIFNKVAYLSIAVENRTSEPPDKNLKTTKLDKVNHGFGIKQMKAIATKYDGDLTTNYDVETQKFSLKILLKNRKM